MSEEQRISFFTQYGKYFSNQTVKKNPHPPFKDHHQLPVIVDILSRKDSHHVLLESSFSARMHTAFLEALFHYLAHEPVAHALRSTNLLYLSLQENHFSDEQQKNIDKDFHDLLASLNNVDKHLLVAISDPNFLLNDPHEENFLSKQYLRLLSHPHCRIIVFSQNMDDISKSLHTHFDTIRLIEPNESDKFGILKLQRTELENFHHVLIPDEILTHAYQLAERYLSTTDTLEKAILLLDSSAARTTALEHEDAGNQFKPALTLSTLTHVLSGWTQIPATHLPINKFKIHEFTQGMQQRVFGQDAAITLLSHELQHAQADLHQNTGPFCRLLFAGPAHCGKRTTALALVEQLFKQISVFYSATSIAPSIQSIMDLKLQRSTDKQYLPLKQIIQQTPHAVIMLENIEHASNSVIENLHDLLNTGYLYDQQGHSYNFRQCILIVSTQVGSDHLNELAKSLSYDDENHNLDLMQLVLGDQKQNHHAHQPHYSPKEIVDEIMPEIQQKLPALLNQCFHVVPFLPLNKMAIEKIIRLKLKLLGKMLDARFGVELGYAPEVIRYLAQEVQLKNDGETASIDAALKSLYFTVEQAILSQTDNKNRPSQLFLQLNETGQLLRCDWLTMNVRHHTAVI